MTDLDREQLKRDCADALEALHRTQSLDGLAGVADSLRALGPPYALQRGADARRLARREPERDHVASHPVLESLERRGEVHDED
jgi:hypothetical protein